ncbi:MAG: peptidoglycan-binding protein [Calothrix sp. C42_A2020_038]|nr:peptidoglycan-binding protein [Calothrix sp. C42_A2020_038]
MKNTGYMHPTSAYEAPEKVEVINGQVNFASWNWGKFSFNAMMRFLPVILSLFVVSAAGQSLAARGASRGEVISIQQCLRQLGYFRGPITGNFGPQTQDAVTRFQRANRLPAIGSVGPRTQQLLRRECNARSTGGSGASGVLRLGSRGQAVSNLQTNLSRLGYYNGPITGTFGPQTQQAVIRFQQANRLVADGVVGAGTLQAIRTAGSFGGGFDDTTGSVGGSLPNALSFGDKGFQVRRLQEDLRQLGFFPVNPTGNFGPTTRDAVANFQRSYGLIPNGVADSQTLQRISQVLASRPGGNLGDCSSARGEVCLGERSQRVILIQQRLQQWGVFGGNADGYYGPATRDAVIQFQRARGLAPTGFVDFNTWQALGLSTNPIVQEPPQNTSRYVVVIPIFANDTLNRVRQVLPQAFAAKSRLGDYVNAGSFSERSEAERLSRQLRDRGFDARVEFF